MPRCKKCREKFEVRHFNQKFCFKTECVKAWVETATVQNWKKTKKQMLENLNKDKVQPLIKKAQKVFNEYIRLRDQKKYGTCISCGNKLKPGNIDAGHYYSAGHHFNIRYHPDNCMAQCSRPCNKDLHGNLANYRVNLVKRIGEDRVKELDRIAHVTRKFTREDLQEIVNKYTVEIRKLKE